MCFSIFVLPLIARSADLVNKGLSCSARHLDTNEIVEVQTVTGLGVSKVITAQWPLGYPTIVIDDSTFVKLPENAKKFVYYHECAHLKLRSNDEHSMDCESINLLIERHNYTELEIRKLIQALSTEFGWSHRWHELLNCEPLLESG